MNPPAVIVALLTSRLQYESGMNSEEIDRQEQSEPFSVPFESYSASEHWNTIRAEHGSLSAGNGAVLRLELGYVAIV